jgi:pimeloyl-ACP methyl ester carboxylesterase
MQRYYKPLRRFLRVTLVIYIVLVVFLLVSGRFLQYRSSDDEITRFFAKQNQSIHLKYYNALGRQIRYMFTDDSPAKPTFLFIHGAPSSCSYYERFFSDTSLRNRANLAAVDRPGYGYSGYGEPEPDITRQAAMIKPILDSLRHAGRPVTIVAASYGTAIACQLAVDFPEAVDGLLLIGPALAPGEEKTYSVSYVLESPFFEWAEPGMLHTADIEKFNHKAQLEKLQPRLKEIEVPVIYMQGENDNLIYTSNALYAKKHFINAASLSVRMIPDRGHLLIYKEQNRIRHAMDEMADLSRQFFADRKVKDHRNDMQAGVKSLVLQSHLIH